MANKLTKDNLKEAMLYELEPFNKRRVVLDGETVHGDVLSGDDSFTGAPPSRKIYLGSIRWIIKANGGKDVKFPGNWLTYTVDDLAEFIMAKQSQQKTK